MPTRKVKDVRKEAGLSETFESKPAKTGKELEASQEDALALIKAREKAASQRGELSRNVGRELAVGSEAAKLKEFTQKTAIQTSPELFGLQAADAPKEEAPEGFEVLQDGQVVPKEEGFLDKVGGALSGRTLEEAAEARGSGLVDDIAGGLIGGGGLVKVAGKVVPLAKGVKLGNAVKWAKKNAGLLTGIGAFGLGAYGLLKSTEGILGYFTGRKIDEQQQALNTIGQLATTIGGESTEGAGDWQKGLQELNFMEQTILELEAAIKAGSIKSAAIKFNGKIYDINADISDQLATIREQKTIIQSFVLQGNFPELSEFELQAYVRDLEAGGYIKPVDLTGSRRELGSTELPQSI